MGAKGAGGITEWDETAGNDAGVRYERGVDGWADVGAATGESGESGELGRREG